MFLVTGGAGFIGSNLVAGLHESGLGPIAVCDRFDHPEKWKNLAKHPVKEFIQPEDSLAWLMNRDEPVDAIFHLGAISSTTETDTDAILANNLTLSQDLWRYCTEESVPFIYASSAATYGAGETQADFIDHNDLEALAALRPMNPYGWSKQLFDCFAATEAEQGNAPPFWAGLRFFNVYGPNEYHKGGQRSVAHQLFEQIRDTGSVTLFKSHHPDYEDGGQSRDFVWVGDCVAMMLWLYAEDPASGIYNCGSGKARSFKDLALAAFTAMGVEPAITYRETPEAIRAHYQYFTEADMSRAREAGFNLNSTGLEDGVAAYIKDYLMHDNPYR